MLTPAAKRRRRAEEANAVLKRPFRSPSVKVQPGRGKGDKGSRGSRGDQSIVASPERRHKQLAATVTATVTATTTPTVTPEAAASLADLVDQFTLDLDEGDHVLERARTAQTQSTESGPSKTTGDGTSHELPALIARWREAGRMAAEEVFTLVSERVERAGGVRAWRTMRQGRGDYQEEQARRPRDDDEEQGEKHNDREDPDCGEESEEEEGFTMAIMLASLQVDVDVLGYDAVEERWKDDT